jgi:hypothetical protein
MTADEEDTGQLVLDNRKRKSKDDLSNSRTRRRVEGYGGDSGVYLPTAPKTAIVRWKTVVPNEPAETSSTLTFDVKSADNELIRSVRIDGKVRALKVLNVFQFLLQIWSGTVPRRIRSQEDGRRSSSVHPA